MMLTIMTICTFIVIGFVINGLAYLTGSNYLNRFLDNNLIVLLVALMAINTTTVSIILTKMREISDKHQEIDFSRTRKSMKAASLEQLLLIVAAILFQILKTSPWICHNIPHTEFILNSVLVGIFTLAIYNLHETAKGVHVILDHGH